MRRRPRHWASAWWWSVRRSWRGCCGDEPRRAAIARRAPARLRRPAVSDADFLLSRSRRPLVLGIGGGGDVAGALATAELCRAAGARPVVGGVTWERRPIDPTPTT